MPSVARRAIAALCLISTITLAAPTDAADLDAMSDKDVQAYLDRKLNRALAMEDRGACASAMLQAASQALARGWVKDKWYKSWIKRAEPCTK